MTLLNRNFKQKLLQQNPKRENVVMVAFWDEWVNGLLARVFQESPQVEPFKSSGKRFPTEFWRTKRALSRAARKTFIGFTKDE